VKIMRMRALAMKHLQQLVFLAVGLLAGTTALASVAADAIRAEIHGIDVVIVPTGVQDVVTITGTLPAGDDRSPADNVALATVTGEMLDQGTVRQDKFAIAQKLGSVGAALSFSVGSNTLQIGGKSLKRDLPLLVGLMAEQLRDPAFSEAELAKQKKQLDGAIRAQLDDPGFRASDAFSRAVFPAGHPNRAAPPEQFLADLARTDVASVRRFHSQYYGPAGMRLVIVGDVDPSAAQAEIRKAFKGWTGGVPAPAVSKAPSLQAPRTETIFMPDKASVAVVMGQPTQLRYADPDALLLRLGTRILGSGGFTSRLMANVRDKEGLTYGISAFLTDDTFADGAWSVQADFAPPLLEKGVASTRRQIESWHADGVTDAELARAKTELAGTYQVGLATTGGLAGAILVMLNRGMPLSFVDEYPKRIAAMTREEVNGAIKRHIDPAKLVLVQAGTIEGAGAAQK
jgi:zinc protease